MQLGVLGPLAASAKGVPIVPRALQPRQVLAVLVLRANDPVPVAELRRELWGDRVPPASAVTVVQNYVAALRKGIAGHVGGRAAARDVLSTGRAGYCLRLGPDDLDATRFERYLREGSRALAQGSAGPAADSLQRALSLWRGPVLSDVDLGPVLAVEAVRLDTLRLLAVEQRLDANMRLGRHYELLGELAAMLDRYPLAERLHQLYMVALHRTGRRGEALRVYESLRRRLDEELGLLPSPSMQRARHAVVHASEVRADDAPVIEPGPAVEPGPLVVTLPAQPAAAAPAQWANPVPRRT